MPPKEMRTAEEAELKEQEYMEGGPSQLWLCRCPYCHYEVSGRSQRMVWEHRAEHRRAFQH